MKWTDRDQNIVDLEMYGDKAEAEVQRELRKKGIVNEPMPDTCPKCGGELLAGSGYVGETVLYCQQHGPCWEDSEDAIRRVL